MAVGARKSRGALAHKTAIASVQAGAPVVAGVSGAGVVPYFAVGAPEARGTHASVGPRVGVVAGCPVLARLVVGAIVEVLVAKVASPALVAVALPSLVASAVLAAGVLFARVTCVSFPAGQTTAKKKRKYGKLVCLRRKVNKKDMTRLFVNSILLKT